IVIVNAAAPSDIEVVAAATLLTESAGRRILFRSAAGFVAARVGQRPPPLLERIADGHTGGSGGLVVAGSYVPQTTVQLDHLRTTLPIVPIELPVSALLDPARSAETIAGAT